LNHIYPHSSKGTSEPGPVAAGSFHPRAPESSEALRPGEELLVAFLGRRHAKCVQVSAQVVESHSDMNVEVRVHTQHHLDHSARALAIALLVAGHRHVCSPLRFLLHYWPEGLENGRNCDGSRHQRAPMRSRSSLSRAAAGRRPDWTDGSIQRHSWLSLRLGQAHQRRRPQPPIAYSQLEAADDLLLGLALGGALCDIASSMRERRLGAYLGVPPHPGRSTTRR
jgi:hypothetical protein